MKALWAPTAAGVAAAGVGVMLLGPVWPTSASAADGAVPASMCTVPIATSPCPTPQPASSLRPSPPASSGQVAPPSPTPFVFTVRGDAALVSPPISTAPRPTRLPLARLGIHRGTIRVAEPHLTAVVRGSGTSTTTSLAPAQVIETGLQLLPGGPLVAVSLIIGAAGGAMCLLHRLR